MTPSRTTLTVTRGLGGVLEVPGADDLALPVLLRYDAREPFAVRAVLLLPAGDGPESVEWLFARDLLVVGLTGTASEGGTTVAVEGREVVIELGAGKPGTAALRLPLADVVELLTASLALVPTGAEEAAADAALEADLAALLAGPDGC